MNKWIAIERGDGGVSIMQTDGDPALEVEKWAAASGESVVRFVEIDPANIPSSRSYREAWKVNGQVIDHDMLKARQIHLGRLRKQRDEKLKSLDVDYMLADEAGDSAKKKQVADEKKRLRNMPQTVQPRLDSAKTIDELVLVKGD